MNPKYMRIVFLVVANFQPLFLVALSAFDIRGLFIELIVLLHTLAHTQSPVVCAGVWDGIVLNHTKPIIFLYVCIHCVCVRSLKRCWICCIKFPKLSQLQESGKVLLVSNNVPFSKYSWPQPTSQKCIHEFDIEFRVSVSVARSATNDGTTVGNEMEKKDVDKNETLLAAFNIIHNTEKTTRRCIGNDSHVNRMRSVSVLFVCVCRSTTNNTPFICAGVQRCIHCILFWHHKSKSMLLCLCIFFLLFCFGSSFFLVLFLLCWWM